MGRGGWGSRQQRTGTAAPDPTLSSRRLLRSDSAHRQLRTTRLALRPICARWFEHSLCLNLCSYACVVSRWPSYFSSMLCAARIVPSIPLGALHGCHFVAPQTSATEEKPPLSGKPRGATDAEAQEFAEARIHYSSACLRPVSGYSGSRLQGIVSYCKTTYYYCAKVARRVVQNGAGSVSAGAGAYSFRMSLRAI